jgi:hypothetical protein
MVTFFFEMVEDSVSLFLRFPLFAVINDLIESDFADSWVVPK